jgi:acyl-CoA reductase-like NAD-dependent aldehyde dehydrogenase
MSTFSVDNPSTGETYCEREYASEAVAFGVARRAAAVQAEWARVPLSERVALVQAFAAAFEARAEAVARDITGQMGKPLAQARGEVGGMLGRVRSLCEQAEGALAPRVPPPKAGFHRRVTREPVGVVLDIAAWNYPLLVPINVVVASVLAGNGVIIKHSPRTPLCSEHLAQAFAEAGAPEGLVTALHVDHGTAAALIGRPEIGYVAFTGSVRGGREVYREVSRHLRPVGMELGGKDAAYVRADADLDFTVPNTAEGAFYNAGQSCCAVERIYVDRAIYDEFVERFVAETRAAWSLGDPSVEGSALGPMALPGAIETLEAHVADAVARGGRLLLGGNRAQVGGRGRYFEATVVADAPPESLLMREESFGPVIGLYPVDGDEEAVRLINDSEFGLTASIWTRDEGAAESVGAGLDVGTVFMNRCDFLDPELPWTGTGHSGFGSSLGYEGFTHVTRPKSWHFRC